MGGKGQRLQIALAAALVFLLQSFAASAAAGAAAGTLRFDAFGNPLCHTNTAETGIERGAAQPGLPDCCAFGCCGVGLCAAVVVLIMPEGAALPLRRAEAAPELATAAVSPVLCEQTGHRPGRPRGPPQAG